MARDGTVPAKFCRGKISPTFLNGGISPTFLTGGISPTFLNGGISPANSPSSCTTACPGGEGRGGGGDAIEGELSEGVGEAFGGPALCTTATSQELQGGGGTKDDANWCAWRGASKGQVWPRHCAPAAPAFTQPSHGQSVSMDSAQSSPSMFDMRTSLLPGRGWRAALLFAAHLCSLSLGRPLALVWGYGVHALSPGFG